MTLPFLDSCQSEWLKQRHSAAAWLIAGGSLMIPVILLGARLYHADSLPALHTHPHFWEQLYNLHWQFMATLLMPLGVMVVTSLVTQLEARNNTWKQVYATPQKLITIYFAKLAVILVLLLECFLLFNIGFYLSGAIPAWVVKGVPYPPEPMPYLKLLIGNGKFFIACLPIAALQYLISLQSKNILVPIGVGMALYVASLIALRWEYGYLVPYIYGALNFKEKDLLHGYHINIHLIALGYFVGLNILSFILYILKKERG